MGGDLDAWRTALLRAIRWSPSPHARRWLLLAATLVFVACTAVAVIELPPFRLRLRWLAIAAVLAGFVPVLNAAEYILAARWLRIEIRAKDALAVTLMASAANLAPLPGAAIVRGKALLGEGGAPGDTARALGVIGGTWVAVAVIVAGGAMVLVDRGWATVVAVGVGCIGVGVSWKLLPDGARSVQNLLMCVALEAAAVVLQAIRLALVLAGLGFGGRIAQTLVLPAAAALANAAGVVPGGLGLREVLAGVMSPLVDLPAAQGIAATATDRILNLAVLAVGALAATMTLYREGDGNG